MIDPSIAASAYGNTQGLGKKTGAGADDGVSFSDFLQKKASDVLDTMKASEKTSAQAVTGEADLTDVVQAVTSAEVTLQTVVALRDRLIAAYQDIMRMPI
ncbi:MAG: flagellar hook-basal body complex protein FliE [Alphaproteobacteria bacterium PRO2]|nr:flagellar hook-basal body complex protein FliE [Alphaproteobacteria bacterium PRO2]